MKKKIALFIATFFGAGLSKKAPGTMGSLATLPLAFLTAYCFGFDGIFYAALIVFIIGVTAIYYATEHEKQKDLSKIVIDETAGQAITLLAAGTNIYLYVIGFILFRIFDISKPLLIGWADRKISGGLGIMLDDIIAGVFGGLILWGIKIYLF